MSELEMAAMNYGAALAELRSVEDCNMPADFVVVMKENAKSALADLVNEAKVFYANRFDGAKE